ncbi:hypothetical protein COF36_04435 [Bacillus pseudomycoides]|nr:hypothetical protein CN564_02815 [Bacillus pseudomycoides]PHC97505.1 hypothetical protein COF36_04435 [Bacillus pseudomycoides]
MNKKVILTILIICVYCFPFVYFSMYKDFTDRSMIGYFIMLLVTSLLAFCCKCLNTTATFIIGNILSAIISYYFIHVTSDEYFGGYFKPLTPIQLLTVVNFLNLIPQLCAIKLANIYLNKVQD